MVLKMYNWKSVSGDGDAFRVWKTEKICFNYIKFHLTGLTDCVIVKNALLWQHVPTILRTKKILFKFTIQMGMYSYRQRSPSGGLGDIIYFHIISQGVKRQWRKTGYV